MIWGTMLGQFNSRTCGEVYHLFPINLGSSVGYGCMLERVLALQDLKLVHGDVKSVIVHNCYKVVHWLTICTKIDEV